MTPITKLNAKLKAMAAGRKAKIRELRAKGWTWAMIGTKYKITRQRAQQLGRVS